MVTCTSGVPVSLYIFLMTNTKESGADHPLPSAFSHTFTPTHSPHLHTIHAQLRRLAAHSPQAGARAVILSPTRELALQIFQVVKQLAKHTDLRMAVLVGGDSMEAQFAELAANPDIMVATPGMMVSCLCRVCVVFVS